jgi:hypothetical protein
MIGCAPAIRNRSITTNFELIEAIADAGNGLVDLWEASPIRLNSNEPNADEIVSVLFPENPLLCCGWTRHWFDTRPRDRWYKLNDLQFIVPNPMTACSGRTQRGKVSAHTLSNTGFRRFLIVEFDFVPGDSPDEALLFATLQKQGRDVRDLSAALLLHLAEKAPLAIVVYSGCKSLHGWFHCRGVPEEKVHAFFRYALSLGADKAHWNRAQFARMPDGLRDRVTRQSVYFFNPAVLK